MSKIPATAVAQSGEPRRGSRYPAPHNAPCIGRAKYVLGDQFGLDQFGVNLAVIEPGAWSSQRHWHEQEDEFVYVLEGELVLVDDSGEHRADARHVRGLQGRQRQRPLPEEQDGQSGPSIWKSAPAPRAKGPTTATST
jgi:hypothetical protein